MTNQWAIIDMEKFPYKLYGKGLWQCGKANSFTLSCKSPCVKLLRKTAKTDDVPKDSSVYTGKRTSDRTLIVFIPSGIQA